MPTLDELISTINNDEPVCFIDPATRQINVDPLYKTLGVESDEKVTRVRFSCPKIVGDGIDLTTMHLYVNYQNANGEKNSYLIDDVEVADDNITFSWLLSRHVTEYRGTITYIICAKKSVGNKIVNEWNTIPATGTVMTGLETTNEIEEEKYDIIEQLLLAIDGFRDYVNSGECQGPKGDTGDSGVFRAIYGETAFEEIKKAYEANRLILWSRPDHNDNFHYQRFRTDDLGNLVEAVFNGMFSNENGDFAYFKVATDASGWHISQNNSGLVTVTTDASVRRTIDQVKEDLAKLVDTNGTYDSVIKSTDGILDKYGNGYINVETGKYVDYLSYETFTWKPAEETDIYITRDTGGTSVSFVLYKEDLSVLPTTSEEGNRLKVASGKKTSDVDTLPTSANRIHVPKGYTLAISRSIGTYTVQFSLYYSLKKILFNGDVPLADKHIQQVVNSEYLKQAIKGNGMHYIKKEITSEQIILEEKNILNVEYDADKIVSILSPNRIDVSSFTFSKNSSSSDATVAMTETGVKITSNDTSGLNRFVYKNFTAEATGHMWISCNAKSSTSTTNDCRMVVRVTSSDGTSVTYDACVGEGLLKRWYPVVKGDSVQLQLYYKLYINTSPNTVEYSNIMIAYADIDYASYTKETVIKQGSILNFSEDTTVSYEYEEEVKKYKCVCFGDSITGMFDNGSDYPYLITKTSDVNCVNCGFSGSRVTDHASTHYIPFSLNRLIDSVVSGDFSYQDDHVDSVTSNYYKEHLENLKSVDFSDVDFVTILIGTNDWGANAILKSEDDGSTSDKQRTNVEDAVRYCVTQLQSKFPHLTVFVLSPYWRNISGDNDSDVNPNSNGDYLYEFSDVIEGVAKSCNCKNENLYHSLGANAITRNYWTIDGTHPTTRAKVSIANRIKKMMDTSGVY